MPEEFFEDLQQVGFRVRHEKVLPGAVPSDPRLVLLVLEQEAKFTNERLLAGVALVRDARGMRSAAAGFENAP